MFQDRKVDENGEIMILPKDSDKWLTKEEFIRMIEANFPDNNTFESIVVALTTKSNEGTFQSFTFGKVLDFNK